MKKFLTVIFVFLLCAKILWPQNQNSFELTNINFEGNKEFSSGDLKQIIQSKETPFWGWKFLNSIYHKMGSPPSYFDSSYIQTDIYSLKSFYHANGFFESQFTYSIKADTAKQEVTLNYIIQEGVPFTYGSININGIKRVPDLISTQLYKKLEIDSTQRFIQEKVESNISSLLTFFYNNGYMNAVYDSSIIFIDTVKNKANLDLHFSPSRRYKISGIDIDKKGEGKDHVSDTLIKELIAIAPEEY